MLVISRASLETLAGIAWFLHFEVILKSSKCESACGYSHFLMPRVPQREVLQLVRGRLREAVPQQRNLNSTHTFSIRQSRWIRPGVVLGVGRGCLPHSVRQEPHLVRPYTR